ncbi:transcription elongation factor, mitochondrial isoform X2 [Marmota marmota marmota]|uniref:transcription elongation factor, mitochondrial isoform X2 n=1 Tax=Marmota marmota marmota TaxID=9994 RepID=UPI0007629086|nr:transcription elongation factor, mitochondrial isoform X2 [Marmota marmota marmota]
MSVSCLLKAGGRWRSFPVPVELSLFQTLRNFCYRKKSTAPEKTISSVSFYDENAKESGNALDKLFSSEQQASILHVLNTASDKELEAFKLLHGKKSISIIEHREKFGPFQDLESLMNVPSFQFKTIVQVCNSILYPEGEKKKRKFQENRLLGKLIKPDIERERLKISSVISKMPKADFYVLEKTGLSIQNSSLFPVLLHFHIIEAMLYALLNKTFTQDGQHHVLSMNRNAVGKHFKLMIGDTRTSGKELVKQFLSESVLKAKPRVFFPPDRVVHYRQMFSSADPPDSHRREELYDSLLQAIAFYELAVFDTES